MLALTAAVAVAIAPPCEELFFRGFVFPGIARSWGVPAGIAASGLLFGASHLLGDPYLYKSLVALSLVGCVFAFVYYKSGNLLSTMFAHFTFNLIAVIALAASTCSK